MTSPILLKVSGLQVAYGGIQAVKGVDFEVREGELFSLIGSNGAGKTTTMKAITGTLPIHAGDIQYLGKSIKGQGPWPTMLLPKYSMSPPWMGKVPVMAFMVVVLPAPLEPMRDTNSPSCTSKSTPLTA